MTTRVSAGRIFSYDVTGGRYEEHSFHAVGSGGFFARGSLKKLYREPMSESDAVLAAAQALYDAADDDSATGGPDLMRGIYPVVARCLGRRLPAPSRRRGRRSRATTGRRPSRASRRPGGPTGVAPRRALRVTIQT